MWLISSSLREGHLPGCGGLFTLWEICSRSWARVRELYGLRSLEVVHDMMLKGLGVNDWRDLIHDEGLSREMLMYTGEDGVSPEETSPGMPKPTGAHVIDSLPFFMKE